jgi:hypothetical protein
MERFFQAKGHLPFSPTNSAYFCVSLDLDENGSLVKPLEIRVSDHAQNGRVWTSPDCRSGENVQEAAQRIISVLNDDEIEEVHLIRALIRAEFVELIVLCQITARSAVCI